MMVLGVMLSAVRSFIGGISTRLGSIAGAVRRRVGGLVGWWVGLRVGRIVVAAQCGEAACGYSETAIAE